MTQVKTSCPICGTVEVTGEDVTVTLYGAEIGTYTFTCPIGKHGVTKDAGPEVMRLLDMSAGVKWVTLPAEALEPKAGPPIDLDYLIGFSLELKAAHPELMRILCEEESR